MERENRKVLISVKVSTLLLILLVIIGVVVLVNVIKNNLNNNVQVANIENTEEKVEDVNIHRVVNTNISSRGNGAEEKRTNEVTENFVEDVKEETANENIEIEKLENTINQAPNIIHGTVSGIKFEEVENSIAKDVTEENIQTISIEEVIISKDMDLTVRTGLSREDFITLITGVEEDKKGFFEENAGLIYDVCKEYQINEIFFCGLIAGESGWHIADNHRRTHNYISLMSSGGLIRFSSVEDGLKKAAEALHNNYLTEGGRFYYGPTLAGVKTKFCPASSTWINLIYGNMEKILK